MQKVDPFYALADPNRRYLLEALKKGPQTVNILAQGLPVSRPAVSQHLKALLDCGFVNVTNQGTRRYYSISQDGFGKLSAWLDQFRVEPAN
ncbi:MULTISPECIES: ArsR/SmtB family transcription factor [unclassified Lentilitoribacter]|jgi:DNA-binding transcriptional ArsR family regulator|uniref:ArsR/SmtB family transcription factor n=1 Tax=unclassified Lentilitoribacter TaxID=2647570 RepID=UPI0013A693A5|nr:metalloregulator ArsR/SmtB family transcription factor [Lentilitoribacter sp. Alg239-R112]